MRATRARPLAWCGVASALVLCGLLARPDPVGASKRPPPLATVVIPDLGPGYSATSEGPLDASRFASSSPDPAAASTALASLAKTISTYERVWSGAGGANVVQDLLVRFPSPLSAQVFLHAAQHSLDSGEIVSSGPLPGVPGAHRTTYFASTTQAGVGQAITLRAGVYVTLLSLFSAASADAEPITPADAAEIAQVQRAAMAAAPGGTATLPVVGAKKGLSVGSVGVAALAVVILASALATPAVLRRRRAGRSAPDAHL